MSEPTELHAEALHALYPSVQQPPAEVVVSPYPASPFDIVIDQRDMDVIVASEDQLNGVREVNHGRYTREQKRRMHNEDFSLAMGSLAILTAGVISKDHPILRAQHAGRFMLQRFPRANRQTFADIAQLVPICVQSAGIAEIFTRYGKQLAPAVSGLTSPDDKYALMSHVLRYSDDSLRPDGLYQKVWLGAFYFQCGPHQPDSVAVSLHGELESGMFDRRLLDETCRAEQPAPEIQRLLAFAEHMAHGSEDWYERLLARPDLIGSDAQRIVQIARSRKLEQYDAALNELGDYEVVAVGATADYMPMLRRICDQINDAQIRRGVVTKQELGSMRSEHKRSRTTTTDDTESAPEGEVVAEEREPMPIAPNIYDFKQGLPKTQTLEDAIAAYAGHDTRLQEGLRASCAYIAENFGSGEIANGIRRVSFNNRPVHLWEMKPKVSPGLGGTQSKKLLRTRIVFTETEGVVQVVSIIERDRLHAELRRLV